MPDFQIRREQHGTKGRYLAQAEGVDGVAQMVFTQRSETEFSVDHTEVPESMRGMGVANLLAARVIADARATGQMIVPICPFFRSYVARHKEETADVIAA